MAQDANDPTKTYTWEEVEGRTGFDLEGINERVADWGQQLIAADGLLTQGGLAVLMRQAAIEGDVWATAMADAYREAARQVREVAASGGDVTSLAERLDAAAAALDHEMDDREDSG